MKLFNNNRIDKDGIHIKICVDGRIHILDDKNKWCIWITRKDADVLTMPYNPDITLEDCIKSAANCKLLINKGL